ncbi:MAG: hypothetical protein MJE63_05845 [Proteobacteria bacterium]|nr:hypothetical protein [Pseudomonadota bacterium]
MIPNISDQCWKKIVENPEEYKDIVSSLQTRIFLTAIKVKSHRLSIDELIKLAYDFFTKNEDSLADDIQAIFK